MSATVGADHILLNVLTISKQSDMIKALGEKVFNAEQVRNVTVTEIHKALLSYTFCWVLVFCRGRL